MSREGFQYLEERVTPLEEIPLESQRVVSLPGGGKQTLDNRLCYNWEPGEGGGRFVECGSVAEDAVRDGFTPSQ